jgi:hypothetical protein
MDPRKVVKHWGSVKATAKALGVKPQAIYNWLYAKSVPKLREYQIRSLMRGDE